MLFVISYSLVSPFAQEWCWAVWRGGRVSCFYNSLPFKKFEHLVLWRPGKEILARESSVLTAWHRIGFSWTVGLWMTVPASERQLTQGREGGKEKNMMSSLRTHPSELSGCSESATYFINIIPSGLASQLPQQPFPKLPVLFLCLKAAHTKEKGLIQQELRAAVNRGIIPLKVFQPQDWGIRSQTHTDRMGSTAGKLGQYKTNYLLWDPLMKERKQQNKTTNKTKNK